jgi:hypothetical protein
MKAKMKWGIVELGMSADSSLTQKHREVWMRLKSSAIDRAYASKPAWNSPYSSTARRLLGRAGAHLK